MRFTVGQVIPRTLLNTLHGVFATATVRRFVSPEDIPHQGSWTTPVRRQLFLEHSDMPADRKEATREVIRRRMSRLARGCGSLPEPSATSVARPGDADGVNMESRSGVWPCCRN